MARIRSIKPEFFSSEQVAVLSHTARLLFIGLWTLADRDGRLEWGPRKIRAMLFPYEEQLPIFEFVEELVQARLLWIYEHKEETYACIPGFTKHQRPHPREPESVLPAPPDDISSIDGVTPWKPARQSVYFIRNTGTGAIKIGRTKQEIKYRMRELQTGASHPLEILENIPGGDAALEIRLHHELAAYRVAGEWFEDHPAVREAISREKKLSAANGCASIPPSPVGREGNGREGKGAEAASPPTAAQARPVPTLIARRNLRAAFEHPRFDVPDWWHTEKVKGLADGEVRLVAFYRWLSARVERTHEDTEPRKPWLNRCFEEWLEATKPASSSGIPSPAETRARMDAIKARAGQ